MNIALQQGKSVVNNAIANYLKAHFVPFAVNKTLERQFKSLI